MSIVSTFNDNYNAFLSKDSEFSVSLVSNGVYVGTDKKGNIVLLLESNHPGRNSISQKTNQISVECNVNVVFETNGNTNNAIVHLVRCITKTELEKSIFLELCDAFFDSRDFQHTGEYVLEVFEILATFFSEKHELSDFELQGLYAELYTIKHLNIKFPIYKYWQTHDMMKFDFSISSKVKLEVKSTQKSNREHHFKHEQLITEMYQVIILSYKFRYDDKGLSLLDLIRECKSIMCSTPQEALRLYEILKDVSDVRLENIRFGEEYTIANMRYYDSQNIPRFVEQTPDGISNAEYDCILDSAEPLTEDAIIALFKDAITPAELTSQLI